MAGGWSFFEERSPSADSEGASEAAALLGNEQQRMRCKEQEFGMDELRKLDWASEVKGNDRGGEEVEERDGKDELDYDEKWEKEMRSVAENLALLRGEKEESPQSKEDSLDFLAKEDVVMPSDLLDLNVTDFNTLALDHSPCLEPKRKEEEEKVTEPSQEEEKNDVVAGGSQRPKMKKREKVPLAAWYMSLILLLIRLSWSLVENRKTSIARYQSRMLYCTHR